MVIVFDMDNTLVDELGSTARPGITALLERVFNDGHTLVLWTNSRRERAIEILRTHDMRRYFKRCVCREDYDPDDRGNQKDIRRVKGDILIDDDPEAIAYVRSTGRRGYLIKAYRKGAGADPKELSALYSELNRRKWLFR